MNVALYAPPTPVGDVWLREVAGTAETGEWVDLNFTHFQVSESRVTNAFRPPADCGPPKPSGFSGRQPCSSSITTPRGRVIHRSDERSPALTTIHYVLLDETLIAFHIDSMRFRGDLVAVVDAFEPATAQDIARLVDETFRERESVRSHPSRYISFTPYLPERAPAGYTPVVVAFTNPRDIHNPYLVLRWKAEDAELSVYEFAVLPTFRPPDSCGPGDPERHFELPCALRFTTAEGRQVYTGQPLSPAHVPIGDTMVVINHSFDDQRSLGQFVDSLRGRAADSIRQFACPDRNSC